MSCLSSPIAAPAEYVKDMGRHSDTESTTAHDSDIETVTDSCSTQLASPRVPSEVCEEEEGPCNVVVRSTFIDLDDGCGLLQRYRRLRRAQTDSALVAVSPQEAYEPGRFSDDRAKQEMQGSVAEAPALEKRPDAPRQEERTTVMLRNIPNNYTRDMFLALLDQHGFAGRYDFAYLPCDFYRDANLGYAFVNLVDVQAVDDLWSTFDGFTGWSLPTAKVCQVSWSGPHQGFKAHVERYRNSPVMHRSVPDHYKPVIFKHGARKPFPRPTKKVKAPTAGHF